MNKAILPNSTTLRDNPLTAEPRTVSADAICRNVERRRRNAVERKIFTENCDHVLFITTRIDEFQVAVAGSAAFELHMMKCFKSIAAAD